MNVNLRAADGECVEWPEKRTADAFATLASLPQRQTVGATDSNSVSVPTASSVDVLIFAGCIAQWHAENDSLFDDMLARRISLDHWHAQRNESVRLFDAHFCEAAAAQPGGGFYGDLLRTADFLAADWLLLLLSADLQAKLSDEHDNLPLLDSICAALVG